MKQCPDKPGIMSWQVSAFIFTKSAGLAWSLQAVLSLQEPNMTGFTEHIKD